MKIASIKQEWEELLAEIFDGPAPELQASEMRRAFYAGVACMMKINHEIGEDDVSEDEGIVILNSITRELAEFIKAVEKGEA